MNFLLTGILIMTHSTSLIDDIQIVFTFEGNITQETKPLISTHVQINDDMYTIINPKIDRSFGKFKLVTNLQIKKKVKEVEFLGTTQTWLDGEGSVGIHV